MTREHVPGVEQVLIKQDLLKFGQYYTENESHLVFVKWRKEEPDGQFYQGEIDPITNLKQGRGILITPGENILITTWRIFKGESLIHGAFTYVYHTGMVNTGT